MTSAARLALQERVRAGRARVADRFEDLEQRIEVAAASTVRTARITAAVVFAAAAVGMVFLLVDRWLARARRR